MIIALFDQGMMITEYPKIHGTKMDEFISIICPYRRLIFMQEHCTEAEFIEPSSIISFELLFSSNIHSFVKVNDEKCAEQKIEKVRDGT